MVIFAIFLCFAPIHSCRPIDPPEIVSGTLVSGTAYPSLKSCQSAISRFYAHNDAPDHEGRYHISPTMWYECLGRRIHVWHRP